MLSVGLLPSLPDKIREHKTTLMWPTQLSREKTSQQFFKLFKVIWTLFHCPWHMKQFFPMLWLNASHTNNFIGWVEWILLDCISHLWEATICAGEICYKHMSVVTHKCTNTGEVRRKKVRQVGWEPGRNKIMFVKHRKWVSLGRPD